MIAHFLLLFLAISHLPQLDKTKNLSFAYVGIENLVHINLNGVDSEDITVKVSSGNVYRRDDSTFAYQLQIPTEEIKIKLYYKQVLCEQKTIIGKKLPASSIKLSNKESNTLTFEEFMDSPTVTLIDDAIIPNHYKSSLVSFTLKVFNSQNALVFQSYINGNSIPQHVIDMMTQQPNQYTLSIADFVTNSPSLGMARSTVAQNFVIQPKK